MSDDLISRQAAIDAVYKCTDIFVGDMPVMVVKADAYEALAQLPSAQPEPCEDAVSREVLKDGFTEMCNLICPYTKKQQHVMCGSCLMGTAFDVLEATPSVTPKQRTGKWIHDGSKWTNRWICSECGYKWFFDCIEGAYCPNCGADMRQREEQNG